MTHGLLFSLHCIFLLLVIKFYEKRPGKTPCFRLNWWLNCFNKTNRSYMFYYLVFWSVKNISDFKIRLLFLLKNYKLLIIIGVAFTGVWIPQLVYWKYVSGNLFIDAYAGEKLFFTDPKIYGVLLSARNGLLSYCPVLILFFGAMFFPNPSFKTRVVTIIFIALNIYLVSCWWCWWYGGSYSMRALIQIFPYLSIYFAGMLSVFFQKQKSLVA